MVPIRLESDSLMRQGRAIHVFAAATVKTWMPGTRPGMTSFAGKLYSSNCILSPTLRSGAFAASRMR
jgi:hypothetical protein